MPNTPKTTPKAEVMKDTATSKTIEADVDSAAKNFEELQANLSSLLSSLKEQHGAILALNEKRLQAASKFEEFVSDTPLHQVAGVFNLEEVKASLFKVKLMTPAELAPAVVTDEKAGGGKKGDDSASEDAQTHETEEEPHSEDEKVPSEEASDKVEEGGEEEKEEEAEVAEEGSLGKGSVSTTSTPVKEVIPSSEPSLGKGSVSTTSTPVKEVIPSSEPSLGKGSVSTTSTPQEHFKIESPLKRAPPEFFDIEDSFAAVRQTSYKLTKLYADQYNEQVIQYVEEWQKVTSDRVKSRLMEFEDHREKLSHYLQKVEQLQEAAEKKDLRKAQAEKLERNKLKLNGAREAHDTYGESLFLLIDEVNERAWKDVFPLLLRTLEFDINYSSDEAKVYSKLGRTVSALKSIGAEYGVNPAGRLHELKKRRPEEFYTGEREVVAPISRSSAK